MEDIKVGEYCRTYEGYIMKCIRIDGDIIEFENYIDQAQVVYDDEKNEIVLLDFERGYEIDVIKSHSPNIIDLVEKDDYVNGYKVLYDYKETDKEQCNGEYRKCIIVETKSGEWKMVDWDIESIVTKEQFESMKYHVGGKEE